MEPTPDWPQTAPPPPAPGEAWLAPRRRGLEQRAMLWLAAAGLALAAAIAATPWLVAEARAVKRWLEPLPVQPFALVDCRLPTEHETVVIFVHRKGEALRATCAHIRGSDRARRR